MKLFWLGIGSVLIGVCLIGAGGYWYLKYHWHVAVPASIMIPEQSVTFPEGWRSEEMATRLKKKQLLPLAGDYLAVVQSTASAPEFRTTFAIPTDAPLTGFLFPDTYRFLATTDAQTIVQKQLATFQSRTASLRLTYKDVILASIVEREAKFDEDRPLIAGVYANRLKLGMALEADPTVQVAKFASQHGSCLTVDAIDAADCQAIDWWPTVLRSDLQGVKSPFNTYLNTGLPPQPICNPGLASLEAASAPTEHSYVYFVSDKEGHAHFATTLAQHNANVAKYR